MTGSETNREGDFYKAITVSDRTFIIRYGFYSEAERLTGEPIPVFPDFIEKPLYDENGKPFVTRVQDSCEYYKTGDGRAGDGWCADCIFYSNGKIEIGICECQHKKIN